jgi:signal transduction histidine kinase/ligand-binding sensor domain-containing protein/DNA-binding NarL/FixJ family response regulator
MYGISIRETASICKDDNGFIWTSSKTGIMRLADDDCRIYQLPYQSTDIVNVKLAYRNGLLVAYTNNGQVFRYNTLYDRFDFLFHAGRILESRYLYVYSLLVDNQGNFWVSSNLGLYRYHQGELTLIENDTSKVFFSTWQDNSHIVFIQSNEIRLMDTETMKTDCVYKSDIIFDIQVSTLYYDKTENKLWTGTTSSGLFYYDFNENAFVELPVHSLPRQPVQAIESCTDSSLLVGIDGQGIWEISKEGSRVLNIYKENEDDPYSLRGNGVYDIFCDRDKQVWVCTYSGGLSFFEQATPLVNQIVHQINNSNSLTNNNVNKILEDSRGNLWFATDNGICCWEMHEDKWRAFYHNRQEQAQVFLSLCEDDKGRIWAGSYSSGVYVIEGKSGRELAHYSKKTQGHSIPSSFIFDIFKDTNGDLWLGSAEENVICYVSKENTFNSYSLVAVYAFSELSPTQMLAACPFGLCLLDKRTGNMEVLLEGYLLQDIQVIAEDIWLCTCGDGLIRFDLQSKTIEKFTTESGLPSNFINSIEWMNGYLWLGTENGLCCFNPEDNSIRTYASLLPLSHISINRNAQCKLSNGQLAFGTNNGAVLFNPEALQQMQSQGRIFFQDLTVSGHSIRDRSVFNLTTPLDSLSEVTLKYNQNNLTLEMLPLGNTVTGARFSWKMEGRDAEWSQPSNHRIVTYTNIPTGRFKLKVRMYDSSLSKVITERQLSIRIAPPIWETLWFRSLMVALLTGIIYFSLRYYIDRLKQRHAEDKIRFFTNTAHDIRTSLTLIKAPVEELIKESALSETGKLYLHTATEQIRRLSSVATQLLDFQKTDIGKGQLSLNRIDVVLLITQRKIMFDSFARNRNVQLIFTFNPSAYTVAIDESMMGKVIDNLLSNAIKYSHPDSCVQILFTGGSKNWTLEVIDQGIGISRKAQKKLFREFYRGENAVNSNIVGSGIGLLLVKTYVKLHGGSIHCISRENKGSSFKIVIPFKEAPEKCRTLIDREAIPLADKTGKKEKMRILIVEDNDDLRNFMLHPLRKEFDVSTANDGAQAWEIIQKQLPDLVVSDVIMPQKNGFELCEQMKSTFETAHIPLILLTTLTGKAEQLQGLGLGADDYLTKPFDMTLLVQRIKSIIRNRKIIREKALKLIIEKHDEPILSNALNDKFVKKAIETVRANMSNSGFGKDEFAFAMNVSASLLYKKIKLLTDQSPTDFIKSIRMNYAMELLQSRKYTVTEVSELCGFSSIGYFSSVFKNHFGKTPTGL